MRDQLCVKWNATLLGFFALSLGAIAGSPAPAYSDADTTWDAQRAQYLAQDLSRAAEDTAWRAEMESNGNDPDLWRKRQAVRDLRTLSWDARSLESDIRLNPATPDGSRSSLNRTQSSFRWAQSSVRWANFSFRVESEFWRVERALRDLEMLY